MIYNPPETYNNYLFSEIQFENNHLRILNNNLLMKLIKIILKKSIIEVKLNTVQSSKVYQVSPYHLKEFLARESLRIGHQPEWITQTLNAIKKGTPLEFFFEKSLRPCQKTLENFHAVRSPLKKITKNNGRFLKENGCNTEKLAVEERQKLQELQDMRELQKLCSEEIDFLKSKKRILEYLEKENVSYYFENNDELHAVSEKYFNCLCSKYNNLKKNVCEDALSLIKLNDLDENFYKDSLSLIALIVFLKANLDVKLNLREIGNRIWYKNNLSPPPDITEILTKMERQFLKVIDWKLDIASEKEDQNPRNNRATPTGEVTVSALTRSSLLVS